VNNPGSPALFIKNEIQVWLMLASDF